MSGLGPVRGYVLKGGGGAVAIVFHLSVAHNGIFRTSGVRLWYRIGNSNYSLVYPQALKVCAPRARYSSGDC